MIKSFFVNQKTPFDHRYSKKFLNKFQTFKRLSTDKVNQSHKNFAASIQDLTNRAFTLSFMRAKKMSPYKKNICFSGGIALNCTSVKEVLSKKIFENIFIPANPSDRGLALGCAYLGSIYKKKMPKVIKPLFGTKL